MLKPSRSRGCMYLRCSRSKILCSLDASIRGPSALVPVCVCVCVCIFAYLSCAVETGVGLVSRQGRFAVARLHVLEVQQVRSCARSTPASAGPQPWCPRAYAGASISRICVCCIAWVSGVGDACSHRLDTALSAHASWRSQRIRRRIRLGSTPHKIRTGHYILRHACAAVGIPKLDSFAHRKGRKRGAYIPSGARARRPCSERE